MTVSSSESSIPSVACPATGKPLSPVEATPVEEVRHVVERARRAGDKWAARSTRRRAKAVKDLAKAVLERADEIAAIISEETGKSADEALLNEVSGIAEYAAVAIKESRAALKPTSVPISSITYPGKRATIEAIPRGVVGIIAPWNYPFSIFFKPLFPALLAGNAVVLKPSEYTPRTGAWLAERCCEVLGEDLVGLVQGAGDVGEALMDAGIDAVTFTGSVKTGKKVAARAGELLIPASVELGGKDAAVVLADCDMERTLAGVVQWGLHNCGQNCGAIERVYVEEEIADEFVARLGRLADKIRVHPQDEYSEIGALQNAEQRAIVEAHIEDARQLGATVVTGAERSDEGLGYRATILDHCTREMAVMNEESFGPIIAVSRVPDGDTAIEMANASEFGLNGSIWTRDIRRGESLARRLDVGIALVNNHAIAGTMANIPWTGTKNSGTGVAASRFSYPTFVRRRTLFVDKSKKPDPWWFPANEDSREMAHRLVEFSLGSLMAGLKLAGIARRRVKAIQRWVGETEGTNSAK